MVSGPPIADAPRVLLYGRAFAADPHAAYRAMRTDHGPLAPVEVAPQTPATLITGYRAALRVLDDPGYSADPRAWQRKAPAAGLPVLGWRPDALHSTGEEHTRLRRAVFAALERVDQHALGRSVERCAVALINGFCASGEADLLTHFAIPLVVHVIHGMLGLSQQTAEHAYDAIMAMRGAVDPQAVERSHEMLLEAMTAAVSVKRATPAQDVTSWLLEHTDSRDSGTEPQQLAMLYAIATQPTWNLIANTLLLFMTDHRFGGDMLDGALSTQDGIDEVLFNDPPLANACPRFPTGMKLLADNTLPAHQPVLISLAGCHTDPAVDVERTDNRRGNRSYLSFGAGEHACPDPAQQIATLIAHESLAQMLDALPDIHLGVPAEELAWLPSAFHRAPAALPAVFPPSAPLPLPI
ncbi:cytochrome P450 [Nocardia nepalensis]|uniref:cytochrome P450 n=1 Tax=Nocardia nepalensis TaxID=3375448 RepID=UPI003B67E728